jgi:hypothetical protein
MQHPNAQAMDGSLTLLIQAWLLLLSINRSFHQFLLHLELESAKLCLHNSYMKEKEMSAILTLL